MSAVFKISHNAGFLEMWGKLGFAEGLLTPIGIVEALCVLIYAIPRTSFVGAILTTAYLGGAVVTDLRVGETFAPPIILGILVWVGLVLRDEKLRAVLTRA